MKKKKSCIIAVLLCLCFVAGMFNLNVIKTKAAEGVKLEISTTQGYAGDKVKVSVSVKENPGLVGMEFKLNYDSSVLSFISLTTSDKVFKGAMASDKKEYVKYAYVDDDAIIAGKDNVQTGEFFTVEFEIKEDAKIGDSVLNIDGVEIGNFNENVLTYDVVSGKISVLCRHSETVKNVIKEATCTDDGKEEIVCSKCGDIKTEIIAATGHKYDDGKVITEATCTEDGEKIYTCTKCSKINKEIIEAVGHKWNDGVVLKEATVEQEGLKEYECTVCKEKKTEIISKLPMYEVIGNKDGVYNLSSDEEYIITVNGDFDKFVDIYVDDKLVDKSMYNAASGSTIITFTKDFMETLSEGEHKISIKYVDGMTTTKVTINTEETENKEEDVITTGDALGKAVPLLLILCVISSAVLLIPGKKRV